MAWCEQHGVDFVFGLARNARLQRALGGELDQARLAKCSALPMTRRWQDQLLRV
jgi:hypothetical protein